MKTFFEDNEYFRNGLNFFGIIKISFSTMRIFFSMHFKASENGKTSRVFKENIWGIVQVPRKSRIIYRSADKAGVTGNTGTRGGQSNDNFRLSIFSFFQNGGDLEEKTEEFEVRKMQKDKLTWCNLLMQTEVIGIMTQVRQDTVSTELGVSVFL